jgi:hypothetical protein
MGGDECVAVHPRQKIVHRDLPQKGLRLDDRPQDLRQREGIGELLQALAFLRGNVRQIDIALGFHASP